MLGCMDAVMETEPKWGVRLLWMLFPSLSSHPGACSVAAAFELRCAKVPAVLGVHACR